MEVESLALRRIQKENSSKNWTPSEMLFVASEIVEEKKLDKAIFISQNPEGEITVMVSGMDKHEALIALYSAYKFQLEG
jgi:hypothetical protein